MTVCIIPARGGSQRIPGKNKKPFHGKPILLYSIETAQKSGLFDEIIVSTDDVEIFNLATNAGVTGYMRPEHLGKNEVGTQEVAQDVLKQAEGVYACVLYATSPLLDEYTLCYGYTMLVVNPQTDYVYSSDIDGVDAGCFYWGRRSSFVSAVPLLEHSIKLCIPSEMVCDINTPKDWERAEKMYGDLYETE